MASTICSSSEFIIPTFSKRKDIQAVFENKDLCFDEWQYSSAGNERKDEASGDEDSLHKDKYISLDDGESWDRFFEMQNNISTNITNTKNSRPDVRKIDNGMYEYSANDENKYNGKYIGGKIAHEIKLEILKNLESDAMKSIVFKESKTEAQDYAIVASARIIFNNTTPICVSDLLNDPICKRYRVKNLTFCLPNKNKTRGIRCQICKDDVRIYEVANGTYEMILCWYDAGKKCEMKISIGDDNAVELIEHNGVTEDQLFAHKGVKVGRQYEAKFLHEILISQLKQKSFCTTM